MFIQKIKPEVQNFEENAKMLHFSYINSLQILHTYKPLNQFQKFKKITLELHIAFIFCFMTILVQPIWPPLEQSLRGRPTGRI